ncbi:MarR family winged helix-turn-helix transcriptional regulator [Hoeflea poritis]|uniref:MarR family transcriptional regulator n=1 Tax=Hoeflea poritis TaxID=2993659 RepID=A0ABT4VTI5_9HYPH|nr:MarR family transcriptional regulator [Hoeflea poritis]MDA4848026.1 MarR family transcriptional regulator [Hoeflea poritis]
MDSRTLSLYFSLFNEVGIIAQLSRALFEARLPKGFLVSHFSVLNHLIRVRDGQTPLQIANAFQVPKTTMTHTLSVLEKHGLIEMRPNPQDGRSKCVWLTQAGRTFREDAIAGMGPDMVDLATQFSPEYVGEVVPKLSEIRKFLDARRDD